jgi:ferrous iron transport protein B
MVMISPQAAVADRGLIFLHGHCHTSGIKKGLRPIVLVGNPNVGKSVIFSLLTGKYAAVSNYPGTTVEIAQGIAAFDGEKVLLVDTPGVNSLIPLSEDERVTRDILLNEKPRAVIQIADAKNLRRSLLLTLQLAEMNLPLVFVLNMYDEARSRGIAIDQQKLAEYLGIAVVKTVATRKQGINDIKREAFKARTPSLTANYGEDLEESIQRISRLLPRAAIAKRALAIMLLAGDTSLKNWLNANLNRRAIAEIDALVREAQTKYRESVGYIINQCRLEMIDSILRDVLESEKAERSTLLETLGKLCMHPIWGVPVLLLVLAFMYAFVGYLGAQVLVDYIEGVVFGEYVNPFFINAFDLVPLGIIRELFVGEYGVITMALTYSIAIILPIVGTFFIAFGVLEDSGYLPRLAIMVNRIFLKMGLNGKAVLPMVLGLGCDTMATLTTRILESRKERVIVTLLLALGVPCSAQLGVILGVLGGLSLKATALWIGIVITVLFGVGFLASRVVPGRSSDFILEVPPLRVPQLSNIAAKTIARVEWYLREAVPLFILGTLLLFALDKLGALLLLENLASPVVVGFLGLPAKATEAFIVGFLRRDYGAAGLFALARAGMMDPTQVLVSLVTITLFVPCIANFLIIIKERGTRVALAIVSFIFPFAFLVGGVLNFILRGLGVSL